jgi:hypothetical protein
MQNDEVTVRFRKTGRIRKVKLHRTVVTGSVATSA